MWQELINKGYQVHNVRVMGNPLLTSEETKRKDFLQESALVLDWLKERFINIYVKYQCSVNEVLGFDYIISPMVGRREDIVIEEVEMNETKTLIKAITEALKLI